MPLVAQRLALELQDLVATQPQLTHITVIGHSMGGLLARYACGNLFDPQTRTICGLEPGYFYTLATPHLGLSLNEGPAQAPVLGKVARVPVVGQLLKAGLQAVGHWIAPVLFGQTGRQFLGLDGGGGRQDSGGWVGGG